MNTGSIGVHIDGAWRLVAMDQWLDVHDTLSARFRAYGLTGDELDEAIVDEIPRALKARLARKVAHGN